jgi:hypothetical protein
MVHNFTKIAILILLALLFAWFYIESGAPNAFDAKLISKDGEKEIKYPFKNLELNEGEEYIIAFNLPVGRVYELNIYEPVKYVRMLPNGLNAVSENFSEPNKTQNFILDITAHGFTHKAVVCLLKHNGESVPLTLQVANYGGVHSYSFGISIVVITLLAMVALKLWGNELGKNAIWLTRIIFFGLICCCFAEFFGLLLYEFLGATNIYDGTIFFAMGRGIANGLKYYTDIFEIKPPGFYFLIAIVIKIFGSPSPMHILQTIVLLGIAVLPVLAYFMFSKEKNEWLLFASILLGLLLALYSGDRAGEVMIESFGACIGSISVFFIASPKFEQKKKIYIPIIALTMLGSCGMKEPFFFAILASSLLFAQNIKNWCYKFLAPFAIACGLGAITLFATGIFEGYLNYLKFMSTTHANSNGSPWGRMLETWRLSFDLNNFSYGFGFFFIILLITIFINTKNLHYIWKFPLAIILTTLAVGAGGEWYDHHHVFAIPFYSALCFLWLKTEDKKNFVANILACSIFVMLGYAAFNLPKNDWEHKLRINLEYQKPAKLEALYLDKVMDLAKVERYAVIANAGTQNFGYTKHSPWGHAMLWDPRYWERVGMHVLDTYISEINKSQIVCFQNISGWPSPYRERAIEILETEFTTIPWQEVADIPQPQGIKSVILFRKKLLESQP